MNKFEETLKHYQELLDKCSRFEGKGKTVPYTSANGHMFSFINKDGDLGFRFNKETQQKYISEWDSSTFKSHGATMNGYVQIPEDMYKDLDVLAKYLNESYDFVMSLDPK